MVSFENKAEQDFVEGLMKASNVEDVHNAGRLCDKEVEGCDAPRFKPLNINGWFWASTLRMMPPTNLRSNNVVSFFLKKRQSIDGAKCKNQFLNFPPIFPAHYALFLKSKQARKNLGKECAHLSSSFLSSVPKKIIVNLSILCFAIMAISCLLTLPLNFNELIMTPFSVQQLGSWSTWRNYPRRWFR